MPQDINNSKKEGLQKLQNLKNTNDAIDSLNKESKLGTLMNSVDSVETEDSNMLDYFMDLLQVVGGSDVINKLKSKMAKQTGPIADECKEIIFEELIQFTNCNLDFVIPSADGYDTISASNVVDGNMMTFKVKSIDPFSLLHTSPTTTVGKSLYEKLPPSSGQLPYSTNRELYSRLQNSGNQQDYFGASTNNLFTIEFDGVDAYNVRPIGLDGSSSDNAHPSTPNNDRKVTDFLRDYFDSINIFEGQNFVAVLLDSLSGFLDVQLKTSEKEIELKGKFGEIIKKILGLCGDDEDGSLGGDINSSGIGHLSEDGVSLEENSTFWDFGPQELKNLEDETSLKLNGLIKFVTCNDIEGKINIDEMNDTIQSILDENNSVVEGTKIDNAINDAINGMATGDETGLAFKLPQLNVEFNLNILKQLPQILISLILTPKVLLGIAIALNAIGEFFETNDIMELIKKFSRLIVKIVRRIFKLIKELVWEEIKKMIIQLVQKILQEVMKEKDMKHIAIISSLIQTLLAATDIIDNLKDCRSVLDTLLKYLKIPPIPSVDIPKNLLFAAEGRPGFSDVRAFQNVLENLQESGINTEPHADGSPNASVVMLYSTIKGVEKERLENSVVKVATYPANVQTANGPGLTESATGVGLNV